MSASASSSASVDLSTTGPSEAGTGVGRRVQPRHFHAGPIPAASSDSDAAAHAASADGPSPAARLYRHALESVFAFLVQDELAAALQVSRGWLSAVQSMRSLQLKISSPEVPIYVLAHSAMGRHVAAIGAQEARASLSPDSLYVLALKMPQLRELTCALSLPPVPAALFFPAALRKLDLRFDAGRPADVNVALQSISRLPLLEKLTLALQSLDLQVSFAPLAGLPRLLVLNIIHPQGSGEFTDAQVDQLRDLPRLQKIDVVITAPLLQRLLRQPHDLQWQEISLPVPLGDETAALLLQLPSLTQIDPLANCERFDWLSGLPNLTNVDLRFVDLVGAADRAESLVAGLQSCTNIEILTLVDCADVTSAHLADLLPRLPRLRELALVIFHVDSLAFLAQPPMTEQLTSLHLYSCQQLPLTELRHVHALRGLKQLRLSHSFNAPLDEHSQWLFAPPSVALPQLELFQYAAP